MFNCCVLGNHMNAVMNIHHFITYSAVMLPTYLDDKIFVLIH